MYVARLGSAFLPDVTVIGGLRYVVSKATANSIAHIINTSRARFEEYYLDFTPNAPAGRHHWCVGDDRNLCT